MKKPLADIVRPKKIEEIVGQEHLTGKDGVLFRAIEKNTIHNMIFYGPPGVGKTSVANVIANSCNKSIHMLNATYTKTEEVKEILKSSKLKTFDSKEIIYIDEIQNFNKKQQQILLDYIEKGDIVLIASTTENPYQYVYKALLSRCFVLEFMQLKHKDIKKGIKTLIASLKDENHTISIDEIALDNIAHYADGDMRKAVNLIELILQLYEDNDEIDISLGLLKKLNISKQLMYDISGDSHYDILSAFQKSIRGSDADASLHYLARLIKSDDLKSICRRLLVIASEDVGLAYPNAVSIVKNCVDSALHVGFPEARLPLAQAVILLATSPKSNSVIKAIDAAMMDLERYSVGDIPVHLKDAHYSGAKDLNRGVDYKYPHSYENNYVKQQYLPDVIKDRVYYEAQNNKFENSIKNYWKDIKNYL